MTANPPTTPPPPWQLQRSDDGKVGGVCEGIARAGDLDVTFVRLAFIVAGLAGLGVLVYILMWVLVPAVPAAKIAAAPDDTRWWIRVGVGGGAAMALIGLIAGSGPFIDRGGFTLGVLLVALGVALLWYRRSGGAPVSPTGATATPPPTTAPAPRPAGSWAPPESGSVFASPTAAVTLEHDGLPLDQPVAADVATAERQRRRSSGSVVAGVFGWLLVILSVPVTIALIAAVDIDVLSVPLPVLFAVLGGAALVNLAVWSSVSPTAPPILFSMLAVVLIGVVGAGVSELKGPIGSEVRIATTPADVRPEYRVAIGHQVVDLGGMTPGEPVLVDVEMGIGLTEIIVPDDADVSVTASIRAGVIDVFGDETNGWRRRVTRGVPTASADVRIDAGLGYGRINICRAADAARSPNGSWCP